MDISVLVYVLLIIAFAKMFGEILARFNQPTIVGELLAGIVLGPFLLGEIFPSLHLIYSTSTSQGSFISDLADLGVLLLMLYVGMEFSPKRLMTTSWVGVGIAAFGMILPMALGFVVGIMFGIGGITLIFLAIAVSVTALPVTIRILKDMEVIHTATAGRIISAALITDVSLLFAMGIVLGGKGGVPVQSPERVFYLAAGYILFFILAIMVSRYIVPQLYKVLAWMRTGEAAFAVALGIAILFAIIADFVGLPSFVGAFVAGMILKETGTRLKVWARVEDILSGVTLGFLAPIFFVLIGFSVDFGKVFGTSYVMIALFVSILGIALAGKIVGTFVPARMDGLSREESLAISGMMMGKGAMELVFARIALEQNIIGLDLFSILVLTAFISTVLAPIMFKHYYNKAVCAGKICKADESVGAKTEFDPGL